MRRASTVGHRAVPPQAGLHFCLFAILMLMAFRAQAVSDYGPKFVSPGEEVATPHITWAKPDAQGSMKVLFVVYRLGMREVVELAQRLDLNYTVFTMGSGSCWRNPCDFLSKERFDPDCARDRDALVDDFLAKLEGNYDAIVIGNIQWDSLPLIIQAKILKKVHEGTPLIGFVRGPNDYFKRAMAGKTKLELPGLVPFRGLPAFAKYKGTSAWLGATLDCAVFGKGKMFVLKGFNVPILQALTPEPAGDPLNPKLVEYDYYLAWIGHLLRCATGRTTVRVTGCDYAEADRNVPCKMEYGISGPDGKKVVCAFAFRDDDNRVVCEQEKEVTLSARGTTVCFEVPRPPSGRYFGDVWVKEGGKTWAYGSACVKLTGDPSIAAIEMGKVFRQEEMVFGKVKVTARSAAEGLALVLRQKDTYGRIVMESRMDIPPLQANVSKDVPFSFSIGRALTIMQRFEVELRKDDALLDRRNAFFSISNLSPREDIRVVFMCVTRKSYPSYPMFAELAGNGFDTHLASAFDGASVYNNIRPLPFKYDMRFFDKKSDWYPGIAPRTKDDHVRLPCLTDPAYRSQLAADLRKRAGESLPFSTSEYCIGDECHFTHGAYELCFSPTCVAAFHKFLASEYRAVEAMNREYETQYKSFDEVQPVDLDRVGKERNLQPLWVDFRRHMENTWAGIYAYSAEELKKIWPEAKVGYEGSDTKISSFCAADFYKLMKVMRLNGCYDGAFVPHAVMSFARPDTLLGLGWYGGYNGRRYPEYQRYIAWRHLFRGANSYWVYTAGSYGAESVMAPDFSFYDFFKPNLAELKEIKRGTGKLLMNARRADDGAAILYSASSVHASTLTKGLPEMERVLNALMPLFEDGGFQFRIISYEQLAQGELKKGGFRLLWLPYTQALSRAEAEQTEAFVREGGTVIADMRPGVRDEHGKPYKGGGILDKVFGVKQKTDDPVPVMGEAVVKLDGRSMTLKNTTSDLSLEVEKGEARAAFKRDGMASADEKPALIINRHGKGKAILLNFSLAEYAKVAGNLESSAVMAGDETRGIQEVFRTLMTQVGIEPMARLETKLDDVRLYQFARDGLLYLGVLQELPEPDAAYMSGVAKPLLSRTGILKLKEKKHIYDVRQGKYIGWDDRIKIEIEPAKGLLFALLPYKVKNVTIGMPGSIGQGETLAYESAVTGEGAAPLGTHIMRVELTSPMGKEVSHYVDNVVAMNGKCSGMFPLALNEAVGKWKIRVRDVASGMTAEKVFHVEKRK
ncbi:MAG: beta-galactosidase trimerization domain-containing protein [Verrucomicrobiae bacterium]|nr:beta-galactosidase trimerization domain-containing protein [Verrucomicrobiae bacterium]